MQAQLRAAAWRPAAMLCAETPARHRRTSGGQLPQITPPRRSSCGVPASPSARDHLLDEREWFAFGFDARRLERIMLNASSDVDGLAWTAGELGTRLRTAKIQVLASRRVHAVSGHASRGRQEGVADLSARHCLPPVELLVLWEALDGGGRRLDDSRLRVRASFRRLDPASAVLALRAD
jgi:hypothetical protein